MPNVPSESISQSVEVLTVTYTYNDEGERLEAMGLEADAPIVLFKEDSSSAHMTEPATPVDDASISEDTASLRNYYARTAKESDVDTNLQYSRGGRCCDPTLGGWIDEPQ